MSEIRKPPIERRWAVCPYCNHKSVIYDNTADCHGVFIKCQRGCKREFELVVRNGVQDVSRKLLPGDRRIDAPVDSDVLAPAT